MSDVIQSAGTPESVKPGLAEMGVRLAEMIGLPTRPVGVYLVGRDDDPDFCKEWPRLESHRYCQALMRARHGEAVVLLPEQLSCPAAAAAFGIAPLPEGLASGRGLVGFGIVRDPAVGKTMFEGMARLPMGSLRFIALAPLGWVERLPDVVVLEGPVESLMWVLLADLNLAGGKRRMGDTAVLQATCVDSTITPFLENRLNFTLGCYGCREATDLAPSEAVLGFPGDRLQGLVEMLEYLAEKAIPKARAKSAHARLGGRER